MSLFEGCIFSRYIESRSVLLAPGGFSLYGLLGCGIIPMLSYPIRQRKGGAPYGYIDFSFGYYRGWCGMPLHHQMAGWWRQ